LKKLENLKYFFHNKSYVLNRDWVDKNADYIPTYDEVVEEEDEKAVEEMEEFERAYNFRHEEE